MAITVDVNGVPIIYPQIGDIGWGDEGSDFAVQTSAALGKLGLASGTSVDIAQTLDVTGNTTLDANLSVGGDASVTGNTTLTGNITVNGNSNLGNGTSDTTAITGILNVDSGVLYVDPISNFVGINDTTPSEALDVTGNALISGTLGVTGDITFGGSFVAPLIKASTSAGLGIDSNNGTDVALFGAGGGAGTTLYGGLNGTTATFSGTISATGGISSTTGVNQPYWFLVDQKTNATNAGTFTSGAWRTRDLNTTIGSNTITGSSLSSNQFVLPSGTYRINASSPAFGVNQHKIKLRNITDSTDVIIGSSENCVGVQTRSFLNGVFTISSSKTFEIQHYGNTTSTTNGFGSASSFSVVEIYTQVELWKIA